MSFCHRCNMNEAEPRLGATNPREGEGSCGGGGQCAPTDAAQLLDSYWASEGSLMNFCCLIPADVRQGPFERPRAPLHHNCTTRTLRNTHSIQAPNQVCLSAPPGQL
jgi:hypothetical protein